MQTSIAAVFLCLLLPACVDDSNKTAPSSNAFANLAPGRPVTNIIEPNTPLTWPFAITSTSSHQPTKAIINRMGWHPEVCEVRYCASLIADRWQKVEVYVGSKAEAVEFGYSVLEEFLSNANAFDVPRGGGLTAAGQSFSYAIDNRGNPKKGLAFAEFGGYIYAVKIYRRSKQDLSKNELRELLEDIAVPEELPAQKAPGASTPSGKSVENSLRTLQELFDKKLITPEEYQERRKTILERL